MAQRPDTRHPVNAGAPGIAIQSALTEAERDRLATGIPYPREAAAARRGGRSAGGERRQERQPA